jgi:hypothetical protein
MPLTTEYGNTRLPVLHSHPRRLAEGVLLSHVEEWDPAVPLDTVVQRIDPTASNPRVQAKAAAGFRMGVVRITGDEYETAVALSREAPGTSPNPRPGVRTFFR